jgi:hypothetical protein
MIDFRKTNLKEPLRDFSGHDRRFGAIRDTE